MIEEKRNSTLNKIIDLTNKEIGIHSPEMKRNINKKDKKFENIGLIVHEIENNNENEIKTNENENKEEKKK